MLTLWSLLCGTATGMVAYFLFRPFVCFWHRSLWTWILMSPFALRLITFAKKTLPRVLTLQTFPWVICAVLKLTYSKYPDPEEVKCLTTYHKNTLLSWPVKTKTLVSSWNINNCYIFRLGRHFIRWTLLGTWSLTRLIHSGINRLHFLQK